MAQLKSTNVMGNLSATGNVIASKIIKNGGTSNDILLANGRTTSLNTIETNISAAQTAASNATNAITTMKKDATIVTFKGIEDKIANLTTANIGGMDAYATDSEAQGYANAVLGTSTDDSSQNTVYGAKAAAAIANTNANNRVLKSGDTMTGTLSFDESGTYTSSYAINAGSKYIKAGWLYHTSGDANTSNFDSICVNKDNWIYYRTKTQFIQDLELSQVYNYKGTLADLNALKSITSARVGDVYFISATSNSWACKQKVTAATGDDYTTYWSDLGKNVDLSGYMTLDTNQTITGQKTFTNNLLLTENYSSIITRSSSDTWTAGIYSNSNGDEVLGILVINPRTHIMLGLGDAKARPAATSLTPAIDIKNNKVGINKRLGTDGQDTAGNYNLDVNGSLNTVSMTLDSSATFTYNTSDKCIDVLFS